MKKSIQLGIGKKRVRQTHSLPPAKKTLFLDGAFSMFVQGVNNFY